jgi:hypothetical protein
MKRSRAVHRLTPAWEPGASRVEQHQVTRLWISQSEHNGSHSLEQPSPERCEPGRKIFAPAIGRQPRSWAGCPDSHFLCSHTRRLIDLLSCSS